MKEFFNLLIRRADYFSQPIQLTFNNEKKFGTLFGGFLSVGIYVLIIFLISNSLDTFFYKYNPKTTMTNTYYVDQPILNMSENQMIYSSYFMTKDFNIFYDPSYFTYSISQFLVQRFSNGSQIIENRPVSIVNCSNYYDFYASKNLINEYKMNSIAQGFCFNTTDILIGGNFNGNYFSNILYSINKCVNSSDSPIICKPKEQVDLILKGGYFEFYYVETNIDLNNYQTPFSKYFKSFFVLTDPNAKKFVDIYIKMVNITSDIGWIFENLEFSYDLTFDYFREQIITNVEDNQVINFYVNSSNNKLFYSRIYLKLQDIAAVIGGILKALFILGYLATYILTNYEMYEYMINLLFHFQDDDENYDQKVKAFERGINKIKNINIFEKIINTNMNDKNHISDLKYKVNHSSNNLIKKLNDDQVAPSKINVLKFESNKMKLSNPQIQINTRSHKIFDSKNNNNNLVFYNKDGTNLTTEMKKDLNKDIQNLKSHLNTKISLNILDLIKVYICCIFTSRWNKKSLTLKVALKKMNKYMDYLRIIKTLQEFHKLKQVLFSKSQKRIFSTYMLPVIDNNTLIKHQTEKKDKKVDENDNFEVCQSYFKIIKKSNIKINKRLIENFDEHSKIIYNKLEKVEDNNNNNK
jgi:hypothetical protein